MMKKKLTYLAAILLGLSSLTSCSIIKDTWASSAARRTGYDTQLAANVNQHFDAPSGNWQPDDGN